MIRNIKYNNISSVLLPMVKQFRNENMFYFNIVALKLGSLTVQSIKSLKWCSCCSPKEFVFGILSPNLVMRYIDLNS